MPRSYTSPLRTDQAMRTRLAIVETALKLFLEAGYAATSIQAIAREAGVSERTVYNTYKDKVSILTAIADHAFYGEAEEGRGLAQLVTSLAQIPDPMGRLQVVMHRTAAGYAQGLAQLGRIVASAVQTDPRLQQFASDMVDLRHQEIRSCMEAILARPLPRDEAHELMIDEIEAVTSDEVYWILAVERAWPTERYEAYLVDACLAAMSRNDVELPSTDPPPA